MVLRRSAWSRSSRFGRAALFCVAWICADARVFQVIPVEVLHSLTPRPSPLHSRGVQAASVLPVIGLAPRGEDGMVASVEETQSSASSTSSGRHSAGLPIVGPPRGLLATGLAGGKSFSGFLEEHSAVGSCSCTPNVRSLRRGRSGRGGHSRKCPFPRALGFCFFSIMAMCVLHLIYSVGHYPNTALFNPPPKIRSRGVA